MKYLEVAYAHPTLTIVMTLAVIAIGLMVYAASKQVSVDIILPEKYYEED